MAAPTTTYQTWKRLAGRPGGTRLFSTAAMVRVPYFASIAPHVVRMEPDKELLPETHLESPLRPECELAEASSGCVGCGVCEGLSKAQSSIGPPKSQRLHLCNFHPKFPPAEAPRQHLLLPQIALSIRES